MLSGILGPNSDALLRDAKAVQIVRGTSYHAGLVAKYWIESSRHSCQWKSPASTVTGSIHCKTLWIANTVG